MMNGRLYKEIAKRNLPRKQNFERYIGSTLTK